MIMKDLIKLIKNKKINLEGKVVAISGCTGGIGKELCRYISQMGATILMLDRNAERSAALRAELMAQNPALCARHVPLDLEDMSTVRAAAEELERTGIDYLILNAGAYSIPRHKCQTGYDNVFMINFASP